MLEQGKSTRRKTICDGMTANPIPHPSVPLRGGGREFWSVVEPGKKKGWGKVFSRFSFISCYPNLICLVMNKTNFL